MVHVIEMSPENEMPVANRLAAEIRRAWPDVAKSPTEHVTILVGIKVRVEIDLLVVVRLQTLRPLPAMMRRDGTMSPPETVLRVAAMQAKVTHGHPAAVAAAQAVAVLVFDGIAGVAASSDVPLGIDEPIFVAAWRKAHRDLVRGERLPAHLRNVAMSGWETVAAAHAISLLYDGDPEQAIAAAAGSGGDTDTVACIVGGIVGARCGRSALPARWLAGLDAGAAEACGRAAGLLAL